MSKTLKIYFLHINCFKIYLLYDKCERMKLSFSDLAVKYVGQSRILDILPRYLDMSLFGIDIVAAVLQCLFVVVEDNPLAMEKIKSNCQKQLQTLIYLEGTDPSQLLIKTLSAGVIINTHGGKLTTLPIEMINQIMSILAKTLSVDHRFACNQLSSQVPLKNTSGKMEDPPKIKDAQILDKQIKAVIQMLDAQQSAIEIIANICSDEGKLMLSFNFFFSIIKCFDCCCYIFDAYSGDP